MDILSNLAVLIIPKWVKNTVVLILTVLAVISISMAIIGILNPEKPGWIEAGTYILGILVPILLLSLIVGYGQSGVNALTAKTTEYLIKTIPERAILLKESNSPFKPAQNYRRYAPKMKPPKVWVQTSDRLSVANYVIETTAQNLSDKVLRNIIMRIELNASKLNFNLLFSESRIQTVNDGQHTLPSVKDLLPHTLSGAEKEGYWFNETLVPRKLFNKNYYALVAYRKLSADFLVSPVHKFDLAQDIMWMLRAALNERPELFELTSEFKGPNK